MKYLLNKRWTNINCEELRRQHERLRIATSIYVILISQTHGWHNEQTKTKDDNIQKCEYSVADKRKQISSTFTHSCASHEHCVEQ